MELGKRFTKGAIAKIGALCQFIVTRLQGKPTIKEVYLAMFDSDEFCDTIEKMVSVINTGQLQNNTTYPTPHTRGIAHSEYSLCDSATLRETLLNGRAGKPRPYSNTPKPSLLNIKEDGTMTDTIFPTLADKSQLIKMIE